MAKATTPPNTEDKHVIVRVRSEDGLTISAHRKVIDLYHRALFAKIGKGLGAVTIDQLNSQISRGIPTYLFVATYEGWSAPFGIYQCELLGIHVDIKDDQKKLVPMYLQGAIKGVSTWFEIRTLLRVAQDDVKRIYVLSSGRESSGALKGATAMFKVGIKGNAPMQVVADSASEPKRRSGSDAAEFDDYSEDDSADYISSADWLPKG